jgi:hypothetical protein
MVMIYNRGKDNFIMNITEESDARIVLKDDQYAFFVGGILVLIAVVMIFFLWKDLCTIPFWLILGFVGALLIVITDTSTVVLDKGLGKCSISVNGILRHEYREVSIRTIKEVSLQTGMEPQKPLMGFPSFRYQHSLKFVLEGGEGLVFDWAMVRGGFSSSYDKIRSEGQKAAKFLGVPFNEEKPPSRLEGVMGAAETLRDAYKTMKKG